MGKSVSFDSYLIEKLSKDPEQAVDYLKLAIEEGDLNLLRMSIDNLIEAGYSSYTITPVESIEQASIQLKQANAQSNLLEEENASVRLF